MVVTLALVSLLAAEPVRVACPGLTVSGLPAGQGEAFSEHVATQLQTQSGVRVTTSKEIAALLGVERQKQLLGCSDSSSECVAELAGALGAQALLLGNITAVGSGFLVTLKLLSTKDGQAFAQFSERAGDADAIIEVLDRAAALLAGRLRERYGGELPPQRSAFAQGLRDRWWIPALVGVVIAGAGAVAWSTPFIGRDQLVAGEGDYQGVSYTRAEVLVGQWVTQQQIGLVVVGVGAAILLASVIMRLVLQ